MTNDAAIAKAAGRYSTVAIILHWLIAALILFEIGLGLRMEAAHGPAKFALFQLHKSIGISILLLACVRLLWRVIRKPPLLVTRGWERGLAYIVHGLFYLLLFVLPLSGWVIISTSRIVVPTLLYGVIPWPHLPGLAGAARDAWHAAGEFTHVTLVKLIYALFALHIAGALKHHFLDRDGDIARMAPGTKPGAWADSRLIVIGIGVVLTAGLGLRWAPIGIGHTDPSPVAGVPPLPVRPVLSAPASVAAPVSAEARPPVPDVATAPAKNTDAVSDAVPSWTISKGSTLRFKTSWSGEPIEGGFSSFDGDVDFNPDHLDRSHVEIRINTASAYTGDQQRDETLKSADWFSVDSFAVATFKADRFRKTGADHYVAAGTLRLKGISLPLSVSFTLHVKGDTATMQGSAIIDRTAFKIGEGDYAGTSEIPAAVMLDIAVSATRKE